MHVVTLAVVIVAELITHPDPVSEMGKRCPAAQSEWVI